MSIPPPDVLCLGALALWLLADMLSTMLEYYFPSDPKNDSWRR